MNIIFVNGNPVESDFNISVSELIYTLESKGTNIQNIALRNNRFLSNTSEIYKLISISDLVIYVSPIINGFLSDLLYNFMNSYSELNHPNIFFILEENNNITAENITDIVTYIENFSSENQSTIIDIQYFEEAKDILINSL